MESRPDITKDNAEMEAEIGAGNPAAVHTGFRVCGGAGGFLYKRGTDRKERRAVADYAD